MTYGVTEYQIIAFIYDVLAFGFWGGTILGLILRALRPYFPRHCGCAYCKSQ